MEYTRLVNGMEMPMVGFGVYLIPPEECERAVLQAADAGYRLFDTASVYENEKAVGRALRASGLEREDCFITSKAWVSEMGYDNTLRAASESLERLGTDYFDLYLIHMPLGDYSGAWRAMQRLYEEGVAKAVGVSNFSAARLTDLCLSSEMRPLVNQLELHPHYQRAGELAAMRALGVQPQAWSPLAGGRGGLLSEPLLARIAAKHGCTVAQVALKWNVQRGVAVIPKTMHRSRMVENISLWHFDLDADDLSCIATLDSSRPSMLDLSRVDEVRRLYNCVERVEQPVMV